MERPRTRDHSGFMFHLVFSFRLIGSFHILNGVLYIEAIHHFTHRQQNEADNGSKRCLIKYGQRIIAPLIAKWYVPTEDMKDKSWLIYARFIQIYDPSGQSGRALTKAVWSCSGNEFVLRNHATPITSQYDCRIPTARL